MSTAFRSAAVVGSLKAVAGVGCDFTACIGERDDDDSAGFDDDDAVDRDDRNDEEDIDCDFGGGVCTNEAGPGCGDGADSDSVVV
jgi:hypothetical protein